MAITTDSIYQAADAIAERGERPTLAAVRQELGGGSFTTIGEALKAWKAQQTSAHELAQVELPDALDQQARQLFGQLWKAATLEAENRLSAERTALAEAQEAAASEAQEAAEAVRTLEAEAEQAAQQIVALEKQLVELERVARDAEQKAAAQQAAAAEKINGLEARLADAQQTVAALMDRIEPAQKAPNRSQSKPSQNTPE